MEDFCIREGVLELYKGREACVTVPEGVHTIGEGAFKACVSLKKVVLPPGLIRIMDNAFKGCRQLEEADIPGGVCYVGNYAFHRCHSLRRVVLPASVEELGDCVFLYCDSLKEACIPGVKRLGKQVFVNDVLLEEIEISRELKEECICDVFTGCGKARKIRFADGECWFVQDIAGVVSGEVQVPPLIRLIAADILRMMELDGRNLVKFRTNLKHVEIPDGIEKLSKSCFFDKRGILSVKFPKSLKEIGSHAFRNCINLEMVYFEGNSVHIHKDAFKNCTSLKTIRTCDGTDYVSRGIFGVEGTDVPGMVQAIQKQVMENFIISGTMLLKYLGNEPRVVVPDGITSIAEEAFAGNEAVDRVILPDSIQEIGAESFKDCLLLQTIPFPDGLLRIGKGAFENCVKLIRVHLPSGITGIGERTFQNCMALKEVCFPEGLKEIKENAFYGCVSVKKLEFPESLETIGELAFYRCTGLDAVHLPAGLKHVGSLAFAKSGVREARISGSAGSYGSDIFGSCTNLERLVLDEGVKHIPDKFAYGCTSLGQVVIPDSLESAGRHALEGTPFLARWVSMWDSSPEGNQPGIGKIFWDGRMLEGEVHLPGHIKVIAGGAFYGNTNIILVDIPESVVWTGPAAFKGCSNLSLALVPPGIRNLEPEVFSGCCQLEAVIEGNTGMQANGQFPKWQSAGERAFYNCKALRNVCLENIEYIGKEAFAGCTVLEACQVNKGLLVGERAFENTKFLDGSQEGLPVIVGDVVVSGSRCSGEVCIPQGTAGIAPYAFAGNKNITKVVFPESLKWTGEGSFWGCGGLLEAVMPGNLQYIGARTFEKCSSLQKIETEALNTGASVFAYCISLTEAFLPNVDVLGKSLFEGCTSLKKCICGNVRSIQPFCFSGCIQLEDFTFQNLEVIKEYAFERCGSLKRVKLQDGARLSGHAFEDCYSLEEIILAGRKGVIQLAEYTFSGCTMLKQVQYQGESWKLCGYKDIFSINIPMMVRLLFHSAYSCFIVEQEEILCGYKGAGRIVKIPDGIRCIEPEVFRDRMLLQEALVPESVEYIGARAFHGTAWIEYKKKESPLVIVNNMILDGSGCTGEVTVTEDIRLVCGWAFANGMGIESIRFLSGQTGIEEYAFRNCIYLKEIILPDGSCVEISGIADRDRELPPLAKQAVMDSLNCFKTDSAGVLEECTGNISRLQLAYGITAIGEGAFQDGNLLAEVRFTETIKRIGKCAFAGCRWLREIKEAYGVEEIGSMAFAGCSKLVSVELSGQLQHIGAGAFTDCTSLEEILLPEGLEEIPARAFYRCHSLGWIQLPSTLKKIGKEAFAFCIRLKKPVVPDGVLIEERAFAGCMYE